MPRLVIQQENLPEAQLQLAPEIRVRVGRAADNEVVLDDLRSSRVHAILSHASGEWIVTDMDSRNGTRLNGKPVEEAILRHGDRIEIGNAAITFESEAQPTPVKHPATAKIQVPVETYEDDEFEGPGQTKPEKSKSSWILALLTLLVAGLGLFLVQSAQLPQKSQPPMSLPSRDAVGNIPNGDMTHAAAALFSYDPPTELPKSPELRYKAYDVDTEDEVQVFLNGQPILALQPTGDGIWSSERRLPLSSDMLKPATTNYLLFQHSFNKPDEPGPYAWGVSDVSISPIVELPCNPATAEENYKIGSKLHEDRRVSARNLFDSIQRLEAALAHSKTCIPKPIFYTEITSKLHGARRELDEAYKFYQVEFTKARKLGQYDECLNSITRIQALIPDREDPRHLQAARWRRGLPTGPEPQRETDLY